jgi:O-antigen/teichoic acid export membrane protein
VRRARDDSLLRNSLLIMATTLVTSALGFVFWMAAARVVSESAVGLTAAIMSASTIVVLVSSLGVGGTLIQVLPVQRTGRAWSRTFWAGMATGAVFAVMLSAIGLVVLPLLSSDMEVLHGAPCATVFAVGTVAGALGATLDYVYIAELRAGDMLTRNAAVSAVKVLMVAVLVPAAGADVLRVLGAWGVASVIGLVLGAALLSHRRRVGRPPAVAILARTSKRLRSRVTGHQLIGMGAGLLPYVLPLLVTVRLSSVDNAYFFAAWMLSGLFLVVSPALSQSLFAEGAHRPDELESMARSAIRSIGAILLPVLLVVLAVGGTLLSAFGPAYAHHGVGLLRVLALASLPHALTNVYVAVLRVQGRLSAAALLNLAMGLGTLAMSWILLPVLGISAVGYAFLALQLCGCVYVVSDWRGHVVPQRRSEAG